MSRGIVPEQPVCAAERLKYAAEARRAGALLTDVNTIPSYCERDRQRAVIFGWALVAALVGWILVHTMVLPDVRWRSIMLLGGILVPHSVLVVLVIRRSRKPRTRELLVLYGVLTAYVSLQCLFASSISTAALYLLSGNALLFLLVTNLLFRFCFRRTVMATIFVLGMASLCLAFTGASANVQLTFGVCAVTAGAAGAYLNFTTANRERSYARQQQHIAMVLSAGRRALCEYDVAAQTIHIRAYADSTTPQVLDYAFEDYLRCVHPEHRDYFKRSLQRCAAGEMADLNIEYRVRRPLEPDWRWVQVSCNTERNAHGQPVRVIGTSCDITHRKLLHARVEEHAAQLEAAAKQKAEFLATMNHQIRTPLNVVAGAASLLKFEDLDDEARELINTIEWSCQALISLLHDALDLDSFESDAPQSYSARFDLRVLLGRCMALTRPLARRKGLRLDLDCSADLAQSFTGDPVRLQQILMNLLSNAVKFTEHGSVAVSVRLREHCPGMVQAIAFTIADTGSGMDDTARRLLFQPFEQVHEQTLSGPSGTGLGLAISKRLVEAMGGILECESEKGKGTRFRFTLKVAAAPAEQVPACSGDRLAGSGRSGVRHPISVLVAEDNKVNRRVMLGMLQRLNCDVTLAVNGAEAIDKCRAQLFDIIFMDCNMPVVNGIDATRRIRSIPAFATVPIVAATAHSLASNLSACLEAGMSDTLTKPVTISELGQTLDKWLPVADVLSSTVLRGVG